MRTPKYRITNEILTRASAVGTATSVAFVAEEFIVAFKNGYMSNQAAYASIMLLSSYMIFITAFIEPIAEIAIDNIKTLSNKYSRALAKRWYALLDITYTACICLYFLDSFNHKSGMSYWYAVALPAIVIALIANRHFRAALHLFPHPHSKKVHKIHIRLIDTACEAFKGFVLGYDVFLEIGYEIPVLNSLWLSSSFGLIYASFHSTIRYLKISRPGNMSTQLAKLDGIFQTIFNLLTTVFFFFYIQQAMAKVNPDKTIQLIGYTIILAYIFIRPCLGPKNQPFLDKVAVKEESK